MKRLTGILVLLLCCLSPAARAQAHKVDIVKVKGGGYQMRVDGKPFFADGASFYPSQNCYGDIADSGANTVRTYTTTLDAKPMLDKIAASGLMLHAGLGFKSVRSGYYAKNEAEAIRTQEERILKVVEKFKGHPAILCWCIGNEIEIGHMDKPLTAQYESIQRLAERIHEIDPLHPVTLAVVDGFPDAKVEGLMEICTDLDFLSVNGYLGKGGDFRMVRQIDEAGWKRPWMSTELGPEGWWLHADLGEGRFTPWGCVVDDTSTEKEEKYATCLAACKASPRCIGALTFLWGWQNGPRDEILEWYGLLDSDRYTYGAVDRMQTFWTGHSPRACAPRIESRDDVTLDGLTASQGIQVQPGSEHTAAVRAGNPAGVALRYHWRIIAERSRSMDNTLARGISGLIADDGHAEIHFTAPSKPGAYRLYIHVYDDVNRKAAYAGIPFLVEGEAAALSDLGGRP